MQHPLHFSQAKKTQNNSSSLRSLRIEIITLKGSFDSLQLGQKRGIA